MCNYDYDQPGFYYEVMRRANKDHVCSECFRTIKKKESYKNVSGKWEGAPSTFKTCSHCLIAQNYILERCNGFLHGALEDELLDHFDSMKVGRFLIGMKRQWKKFKTNELMSSEHWQPVVGDD